MKIKDQDGATVVEFALVLPLLVVFIFGIIEFSLLSYNKAMITNASREAARNVIVYRYPELLPDEIKTQAKNVAEAYCFNHLISFDGNTIPDVPPNSPDFIIGDENPDNPPGDSGDSLTVTVKYNYQFLIFPNVMELIKGSYTNSILLQAKTVMKFE